MDIVVPPGCAAGSSIEFSDPSGRTLLAVVPEGFVEGDTFRVEPPSPEDALDDIMEALTQDAFLRDLEDHIASVCDLFLVFTDDGTSYTLEQTQAHQSYVALYEEKVESYLTRFGVTNQTFLGDLLAAQQRPGFDKFMADSLASSLLAVEDFASFAERCQMMAAERRKKAEEEAEEEELGRRH